MGDGVPFHERTWKIRVRGEVIEVPTSITIREIKEKLPPDLLEEFTEQLEAIWGHSMWSVLVVWGLPMDKLREHRREYAETLYRSVQLDMSNVLVPDDLDVDEIIRTGGRCLLDGSDT